MISDFGFLLPAPPPPLTIRLLGHSSFGQRIVWIRGNVGSSFVYLFTTCENDWGVVECLTFTFETHIFSDSIVLSIFPQ